MPDPRTDRRPRRSGRPPRGLPGALLPVVLPALLLLCAAGSGPPSAARVAGGAGAAERPVVRTAEGPVRGRAHGAYDTFEGIPYAAPPTGPLRWRPPQGAPR
ncbi:carboxylesterase family protein, partial [Streptomyces sp. NPDC000075]